MYTEYMTKFLAEHSFLEERSYLSRLEALRQFIRETYAYVNRQKINQYFEEGGHQRRSQAGDLSSKGYVPELDEEQRTQVQKYMNYIVSKSIVPRLKSHILKKWAPRSQESDALIDVLQVLQDSEMILESQLQEIAAQLVQPKLNNEIRGSDFLQDQLLPHMWIHPWFQIITADGINEVNANFIQRLSQNLYKWEPENIKALAIIQPWLKVLTEKELASIVTRFVLPKLTYLMS